MVRLALKQLGKLQVQLLFARAHSFPVARKRGTTHSTVAERTPRPVMSAAQPTRLVFAVMMLIL